MGGPKTRLYNAQGKGVSISSPGQQDTNIYFAGNNTTFDAEEGALISAMAMANYAFGVEYPLAALTGDSLFAFFLYNVYNSIMFPSPSATNAVNAAHKQLPRHGLFDALKSFASQLIASAAETRGAVRMAAVASKPSSVRTKKAKPAKRKSTAKKTKPAKKRTAKKAKPAKKKITARKTKPVKRSTKQKPKPQSRKPKTVTRAKKARPVRARLKRVKPAKVPAKKAKPVMAKPTRKLPQRKKPVARKARRR